MWVFSISAPGKPKAFTGEISVLQMMNFVFKNDEFCIKQMMDFVGEISVHGIKWTLIDRVNKSQFWNFPLKMQRYM